LTAFTRSPAQGTTTESGEPVHDEIVVFEVMTETLDVPWWGSYRLRLEREFRSRSDCGPGIDGHPALREAATKDIEQLFLDLGKSPFRRRFRLGPQELRYLDRKSDCGTRRR
jgi:hypothetical protein